MVKINPSIFREYDIRGIAAKDLSAPFAQLLGLAYSVFVRAQPQFKDKKNLKVSVGKDCRLTSDTLADALTEGLRLGGIDVVSLGICPTPLTYFSIFHLHLDGGIMVTGSHNPGDYNGFKSCVGKDTIHGTQIQELLKIMNTLNSPEKSKAVYAPKKGTLESFEVIPAYSDHVIKNARPVRPMKIVIDAGNGTAATVAPAIFERMGATVTQLYCELDGRFPNHHPDPTVVENLRDLMAAVKKEGAAFGLAFDGDSDRVGLVDEKGGVLFGDEIMVLLSRSVLAENPGATIISEVKSSHRLYEDIAKKGGVPIMWKTGHSLIKSKMKETKALLAGEMSGHIFFADRYFGYDDAIYAGMRIYEIVSAAKQPLSQLIGDLEKTVVTPEIRVDCEEDKKFALVEEAKRRLSLLPYKNNDIDGIRVDFGDGWGLIRASNTQPVLVLRFEAPTAKRLEELRLIVETALHEAAKTIGHSPINTRSGGAGH